jgi:hypothetical protein
VIYLVTGLQFLHVLAQDGIGLLVYLALVVLCLVPLGLPPYLLEFDVVGQGLAVGVPECCGGYIFFL